jgi:hypothetical protein
MQGRLNPRWNPGPASKQRLEAIRKPRYVLRLEKRQVTCQHHEVKRTDFDGRQHPEVNEYADN